MDARSVERHASRDAGREFTFYIAGGVFRGVPWARAPSGRQARRGVAPRSQVETLLDREPAAGAVWLGVGEDARRREVPREIQGRERGEGNVE